MYRKFLLSTALWLFAFLSVFGNPNDDAQNLIDNAFAKMSKGEFRPALEFLTRAQILAEKHRLYDQQFVCSNNMGIIYFSLNNYGEALNHYLEAYTKNF